MNQPVKLNGAEVWASLGGQDSGIQIRLSRNDWARCRRHRGAFRGGGQGSTRNC